MFTLLKKEGNARKGRMVTSHGSIETPVFMNVGTQAAIKGGLSSVDLENIGCQVELSNTYHLHVRPGDEVIKHHGGLHSFMSWNKPILTDSGGFQIFSLAKLRQIKEEGVSFNSHIDGRKIFMGPEESMQIQANLGSDIAMAFDECVENPSPRDYVAASCERTARWLERCRIKHEQLILDNDCPNKGQLLFGINQGGTYPDLRIDNMKKIAELGLSGYAIGGLAVGESTEVMYDIIEQVEPHMPYDKPRYLMGVGTPLNIINGVLRGIDFFDCVLPARNARHGHLYTSCGRINLKNKQFELDTTPIDPACDCPVCTNFSKGYIRHLLKAEEVLGLRLCVMHNLYFYNKFLADIRKALDDGNINSMLEKARIYESRPE